MAKRVLFQAQRSQSPLKWRCYPDVPVPGYWPAHDTLPEWSHMAKTGNGPGNGRLLGGILLMVSWFAEILAPNCYGFHIISFYRISISTRTSEASCHQRYDCIWCGSPTCQVTSNWINASCCLPMRCFKVPHRLALIFKNVETC